MGFLFPWRYQGGMYTLLLVAPDLVRLFILHCSLNCTNNEVPVPAIRHAPGTPYHPPAVTPSPPSPYNIQPLGPSHMTPQTDPRWIDQNNPVGSSPGNTPVWPSIQPPPMYSAFSPAPFPALPIRTPLVETSPLPRWEPGTFPVEPFGTPVPFHLHPHLIMNPLNPNIPILQWDIIHRAEQASTYTGRQILVRPNLGAAAMEPAPSKIYISSDHPVLAAWMKIWGPIMIEKPKITIRDVLDGIYDYFERPLTRSDLRRLRRDPNNTASLTYSAHQRAGDSYELYPVGLASGFRRSDAMGGHRRFQGLRPVVFQDSTWKLFLGLLPGPVPRRW